MLVTAHAISGGVVGEAIGSPFLAFLVGFIIHFIIDAIPHYDTTDKNIWTKRQLTLILLDILVGFYIILYVMKINPRENISYVFGAIGGIFPDILDVVPLWNKAFRRSFIGKPVHRIHEKIQPKQIAFVPGILVQLIVVVLFSYLYFRLI